MLNIAAVTGRTVRSVLGIFPAKFANFGISGWREIPLVILFTLEEFRRG